MLLALLSLAVLTWTPPPPSDAGRLTALVTSHTCVAHVYEGTTLRWAARLPFAAVCAARLRLGQLSGLLALLSPSGQLAVAYLGTTPSLFVAPPVQTAGALDYETLDEELAVLSKVIQRSQKQDGEWFEGGGGDLCWLVRQFTRLLFHSVIRATPL